MSRFDDFTVADWSVVHWVMKWGLIGVLAHVARVLHGNTWS